MDLIAKGFTEISVGSALAPAFTLDVKRGRELLVIGKSPQQAVWLQTNGVDHNLICIHNYDYDGPLSEIQLDLIISIFSRK